MKLIFTGIKFVRDTEYNGSQVRRTSFFLNSNLSACKFYVYVFMHLKAVVMCFQRWKLATRLRITVSCLKKKKKKVIKKNRRGFNVARDYEGEKIFDVSVVIVAILITFVANLLFFFLQFFTQKSQVLMIRRILRDGELPVGD